jgi:hypothetical protein
MMIFKYSVAYFFENDVILLQISLLRSMSVFAVLIIDVFDDLVDKLITFLDQHIIII